MACCKLFISQATKELSRALVERLLCEGILSRQSSQWLWRLFVPLKDGVVRHQQADRWGLPVVSACTKWPWSVDDVVIRRLRKNFFHDDRIDLL